MSGVRGGVFATTVRLRAQWVAQETGGRERVTMRWVAGRFHRRGVRPA
ncbi:hypothetical protein [Dactylosporangium sp. NPDC000521]